MHVRTCARMYVHAHTLQMYAHTLQMYARTRVCKSMHVRACARMYVRTCAHAHMCRSMHVRTCARMCVHAHTLHMYAQTLQMYARTRMCKAMHVRTCARMYVRTCAHTLQMYAHTLQMYVCPACTHTIIFIQVDVARCGRPSFLPQSWAMHARDAGETMTLQSLPPMTRSSRLQRER